MVHAKVRYELIIDKIARRPTFKKRKSSLLKKLHELKTLCNVDACAIIYEQDETQPDVWPSPLEAFSSIQRFNNMTHTSKTSHMINGEGFFRQNLSRLTANLDKEKHKVQLMEMELLLANCLDKNDVCDVSDPNDLQALLRLLERKLPMVSGKIAAIESSESTPIKITNENTNKSQSHKEKQAL
ncbi:AGAMOUS-like 87 [Abeliophyllum distichum]|uniref:AGAMOUS-like 87 n=1 Tax=Abeliophyllum distichum TaxID=126358 RepID=A0ABD1TF81_9LAMI